MQMRMASGILFEGLSRTRRRPRHIGGGAETKFATR
jgi:hypothetical protein